MQAMAGRRELQDGSRTLGMGVEIGVFTQDLAQDLPADVSGMDFVLQVSPPLPLPHLHWTYLLAGWIAGGVCVMKKVHAYQSIPVRGVSGSKGKEPSDHRWAGSKCPGCSRSEWGCSPATHWGSIWYSPLVQANGMCVTCQQMPLLVMVLSRECERVTTSKRCAGGEKARVALGVFMLRPYNCLLLDEASNHLDRPSAMTLAQSLSKFEGERLVFVASILLRIEGVTRGCTICGTAMLTAVQVLVA